MRSACGFLGQWTRSAEHPFMATGCRPRPSIVLHAKVTLWLGRIVRIVVGSHNMTNDGYRHNREHMGVRTFILTFHHALLSECLGWLKNQTSMPLNRFLVGQGTC